ncbi:9153_t:CDS:1, partial [Gigaspora margarita]
RIIHAKCVIKCDSDYGPVFGGNFFMKDDKTWQYVHHGIFDEKRLRSEDIANLLTDEFEVFQVLKD